MLGFPFYLLKSHENRSLCQKERPFLQNVQASHSAMGAKWVFII